MFEERLSGIWPLMKKNIISWSWEIIRVTVFSVSVDDNSEKREILRWLQIPQKIVFIFSRKFHLTMLIGIHE